MELLKTIWFQFRTHLSNWTVKVESNSLQLGFYALAAVWHRLRTALWLECYALSALALENALESPRLLKGVIETKLVPSVIEVVLED
jgi:hypothetical protein